MIVFLICIIYLICNAFGFIDHPKDEPPFIREKGTNFTATEGDNVTLSCSILDFSDLTIPTSLTWIRFYKNETIAGNGSSWWRTEIVKVSFEVAL